MKISHEKPPVYDKCVDRFGIDWESTIFAYGDTIHCKNYPTPDIIVHEEVHLQQQNGEPEKWWERYFEDSDFRLSQEIPAYRKQYQYLKSKGIDRNVLDKHVRFWSLQLSSKAYGYIITYKQAYDKIISNS